MAEQKKKKPYQIRFSQAERDLIDKAAEAGDTLASRVIREGALEKAKEIIKEIEKNG